MEGGRCTECRRREITRKAMDRMRWKRVDAVEMEDEDEEEGGRPGEAQRCRQVPSAS